MWTKDPSKTSSNIFILLGQFFITLLAFIYLDYVYLANIRPDQLAKQQFVQTDCLVMSKKLSTKGKILRRYRADFLVNYHANGAQYNRWVSANGLDMSHTIRNNTQQKLLSDYENGITYPCWYNSKNAEEAFLVPRNNWLSLPMFLVALIGLGTFILFIKNGVLLFRSMNDTH